VGVVPVVKVYLEVRVPCLPLRVMMEFRAFLSFHFLFSWSFPGWWVHAMILVLSFNRPVLCGDSSRHEPRNPSVFGRNVSGFPPSAWMELIPSASRSYEGHHFFASYSRQSFPLPPLVLPQFLYLVLEVRCFFVRRFRAHCSCYPPFCSCQTPLRCFSPLCLGLFPKLFFVLASPYLPYIFVCCCL